MGSYEQFLTSKQIVTAPSGFNVDRSDLPAKIQHNDMPLFDLLGAA